MIMVIIFIIGYCESIEYDIVKINGPLIWKKVFAIKARLLLLRSHMSYHYRHEEMKKMALMKLRRNLARHNYVYPSPKRIKRKRKRSRRTSQWLGIIICLFSALLLHPFFLFYSSFSSSFLISLFFRTLLHSRISFYLLPFFFSTYWMASAFASFYQLVSGFEASQVCK